MLLYDLHKYILLFSLFYPELFSVLLATNIFVAFLSYDIKNNPPEQIHKICFRGYHKGSIPDFFLLHDLASVRCHLEFRSEHFTRAAAHEHPL